jgi:hypothetical protein
MSYFAALLFVFLAAFFFAGTRSHLPLNAIRLGRRRISFVKNWYIGGTGRSQSASARLEEALSSGRALQDLRHPDPAALFVLLGISTFQLILLRNEREVVI